MRLAPHLSDLPIAIPAGLPHARDTMDDELLPYLLYAAGAVLLLCCGGCAALAWAQNDGFRELGETEAWFEVQLEK